MEQKSDNMLFYAGLTGDKNRKDFHGNPTIPTSRPTLRVLKSSFFDMAVSSALQYSI